MHPPRTIGSLFSGIGGLERGVEWATGARTVFQVEKEPFCRDVLAKHWPDAVRHDDVCAAGGIPYRIVLPSVDALVGGSPCQGVSLAGLREGFEDERSGLWREYQRIVAYLRPRFVFLENVPGLASSQGGWDFGEVLGGLADLGYDATWDCFRASDVGAPHRRERLFLLAYATGVAEREPADEAHAVAVGRDARVEPQRGGEPPVADAVRERLQGEGGSAGWEGSDLVSSVAETFSPVRNVFLNADWLETLMGFPVGWTQPAGPLGVVKCSTNGSPRVRSKAALNGPRE